MTLLPMENRESILCALKCFEKEKPNNIPPVLEDYIRQIARNGQTMIPWVYIKPLLLRKFNKVMDGFPCDSSAPNFLTLPSVVTDLRQRVYDTLKRLDGIPFTIQRICELLENPFRHYSRPDKYLRGFEKVCMVVSTVDPQGNKIHLEDPRFPSRAGLDECNLVLNDQLVSPPTSPCIYDLHRRRPSRSSDEEEATDEDENEDEEDVPTEDSSHDSSNSPGATTALGQPPLLTTTTSPGAWLFGSQTSAESSSTASMHVESTNDTKHLSQAFTTTSMSIELREPALSEELESTDEKDKQEGGDNKLQQEVTERSSDDIDEPTRVTLPRLASPDADLPMDSEVRQDEWLAEAPLLESPLPRSSGECSPPGDSEGVPPIVNILRPIGQLEAFVQNVGADLAPSPPTSLPSKLISSSIAPLSASESKTPPSESCEEQKVSLDAETSTKPAIGGTKRRASSPDSSEPASTPSDTTVEEYHNSPAKRRRLTTSIPGTPENEEPHQTSVTALASLNGSPPIIICNSVIPSRDRDSGEQTCSIVLSSTSSNSTVPENADIETEASVAGEHNQADSPISETLSHQAHHIDSETGEEEAEMWTN